MRTSPLGSGSGRRNPLGDRRFISRSSTSSSTLVSASSDETDNAVDGGDAGGGSVLTAAARFGVGDGREGKRREKSVGLKLISSSMASLLKIGI